MTYDCIIIGGGAAGLCCAAALKTDKGLILEGSSRPGSKLLLTGGGHCNVTHSGSIKDFISLYGSSGRSLRTALYRHSNIELINALESGGVPVLTNEEGKVYPRSMEASSVLNLLLSKVHNNGWQIYTDSKVTDIDISSYITIHTAGSKYLCRRLVIATGGITYAGTGSDGSMFSVLHDSLNVDITAPRSALAPIRPANYPYSSLAGISLQDVSLRLRAASGKVIAAEKGQLLFTHKDLSGPAVLNISRFAEPGMSLELDYSGSPLIPQRLRKARELWQSSGMKKPAHYISESADKFVISSISRNGMITVGGVSLDALNCRTMALKSYPDIYIIGEALDAAGPTGGYNLQLCYSTARAAADDISSASYLRL